MNVSYKNECTCHSIFAFFLVLGSFEMNLFVTCPYSTDACETFMPVLPLNVKRTNAEFGEEVGMRDSVDVNLNM
jgi:hypothetical protein